MKAKVIIGIILMAGAFICFKIFEDSIPKINEPITNIVVFVGFVTFAIVYGLSQIRKK
jgi:hypothetical protein